MIFFRNFRGPMKHVNPLKTPFYIPCLLKRLAPCGRINQFDGIYCSIGVPPVHFNSSLLLMLKMLLTYLAGMMQMMQIISTGHDCHRSGMMLVRALSRSNEMTTTQQMDAVTNTCWQFGFFRSCVALRQNKTYLDRVNGWRRSLIPGQFQRCNYGWEM